MRTQPGISSFALAALYGALFSLCLGTIWGYYATNHPLSQWLLDSLLRKGHVVGYYSAVYAHDLLFNAIVALPFAYLIGRLRPRFSWPLLVMAVVVAVGVEYWPALLRPRSTSLVLSHWQGLLPLAMLVVSLPIGFSLLKYRAPHQPERQATKR